jgi:hypothetical protein
LGGSAFMCVDNVVGHWKSPTLASFLTTGRLSDRLLGQSANVTAEVLALLTATGNNASLDADLSRRFLRCRIDSGVNPTQRAFSFSPTEHALRDRLAIAEAACLIWQGYFAKGAPRFTQDQAGGYVQWDRLARQPVLWLASLGVTDVLGWGAFGDPASSMLSDPSSSDPELEAVAQMWRALAALSDGRPFTTAQMLQWVRLGESDTDTASAFWLLYEALSELMPGRMSNAQALSSITLGKVLQNRRDRASPDSLCLRALKGAKNTKLWRIEAVSG